MIGIGVGSGAGVAVGATGCAVGAGVGLAGATRTGRGETGAGVDWPAVAAGAGAGGAWAAPPLSVKPLMVLANCELQTTGLGLPVVTVAAPLKATAIRPAAAAQVRRFESDQGLVATRIGGRRYRASSGLEARTGTLARLFSSPRLNAASNWSSIKS